MKFLKQIKFFLFLFPVMLSILTGCVKSNGPGTAFVGLHLHTYIGSNLVAPGDLQEFYPDSLGRIEELQYAQFYITNVSFHSTTRGWITLANSVLLKREEYEEYVLGNIPADNYDDVRFTFGLGNTLDQTNPSSYSTSAGEDTVLSAAESFMYQSGAQPPQYSFMKVAGWVDTTTSHKGNAALPNLPYFNYTIGGLGDTLVITLPVQAFSLTPQPYNSIQLVHVICDYGKMLQNIQVTNPTYSTGSSFSNNAQQQQNAINIFNAIKNMFRYECYAPTVDC